MAVEPGNIQFLVPAFLWLLPLLYVCEFFWVKRLRARVSAIVKEQETTLVQVDLNALEPTTQGHIIHPLMQILPQSRHPRLSPLLIRAFVWLILTALVVALGQPIRIEKKLPDRMEQRDITFIVDTSLSMTLRDYELDGQRVERIHLLKSLLKKFVKQLVDDRMSIIVFGETAHTLVPLTKDQTLLREMIERISAGMVGRHNAIGDSIALAVRDASNYEQGNRILVLLTDAGTHTGKISPFAAAELVAEAGMTLYTVAIGATTAAAEEHNLSSGLLFQTVEMSMLHNLAGISAGKSYLASDSKAINSAINDIIKHDSKTVLGTPHYTVTQLYPWLVVPALLGLTILPLLGWRQA